MRPTNDENSDALADVLRWLARVPTPADIAGPEADLLADALGLQSAAPDQILSAIDKVIAAMPADEYGSAARWMLGTTEFRWSNLTARRKAAGEGWQISDEGFRHGARRSKEFATYRYVASAIVARSVESATGTENHGPTSAERNSTPGNATPASLGASTTSSAATDPPLDRMGSDPRDEPRRRRWVLVAGCVVGASLIVILAAIATGGGNNDDNTGESESVSVGDGGDVLDDDAAATTSSAAPTTSTASTTTTEPPDDGSPATGSTCAFAVGAHDGDDLAAARAADAVIAEYRRLGGALPPCANGPLATLAAGPIVAQPFGDRDRTPSTVIVTDGATTLALPFAAWGSYAQIGSRDGSQAHAIAGSPIGLTERSDASYVLLDSTVQLIAEKREAPYYFVLEAVAARWDDLGGLDGPLGLPRSNPYPVAAGFRQDFDGGYLLLGADTGTIEFFAVEEPEVDLPDLDQIAGRLIRHDDGTSWLVTSDGQRKWIPDGPTWICLERGQGFAAESVPGHAIAILPYAGVASCDDVG